MDEERVPRLFELADLILAVGRHIGAAKEGEVEAGTPLEGAVMRYVDRHPGTTAGEAAEATRMISSNFARAVRRLEKADLIRRDADQRDGRRVRLYPTEKARENLRRLHQVWSRLLEQAVTDSDDLDTVISALRTIETRLIAQTRTGPE